MKGPFVTSNGDDIYEQDNLLQWILWLTVTFYIIATLFYIGIFINNVQIEHTYVKHPSTPGTLTSDRYNLYWVAYFLTIVVAVFFPVVLMLMILFRETYGCNVFNTVVFVIAFSAHLFAVIVLLTAYVQANKVESDPNNPANSKLWCCLHEIYSNPINDCPNVTPCIGPNVPASLSELQIDPDFLWIFWLNVYFLVLHVVFGGVIASYWQSPTKDYVYKKMDDEDVESKISIVSSASVLSSRRGATLRNFRK